MPSAHACWLAACSIKQAETVVQVGAGSGYYAAILAHLVGADGRIYSYEIDEMLAERARDNLKEVHQVEVRTQSGDASDLPQADLIYVCAAATQPSRNWLAALRPGGRLLFPLAPQEGIGGMLLVTHPGQGSAWPAKFAGRAAFIGCVGLQDEEAGRRLTEAFSKNWDRVRSLHLDGHPMIAVGLRVMAGGFQRRMPEANHSAAIPDPSYSGEMPVFSSPKDLI
jgi:protein-L-isoaspartate(D-aspartate) O-methyltransferase